MQMKNQTGTEITTQGGGNSQIVGDALELRQLENMLSDLRWQPKWREEAMKSDDYYDGHQLTGDRLARMERLGIPPLITNLIAPAVNAVLGMEAKTRTDWRVTQENEVMEVPEPMMDAMNAKLNEAEREARADRAISDAYAAEIKSGLGWVEVARSTDALAYPYRVKAVHRDEMYWDWHAREPDLSDARYLIRKRVFDEDVLTALMPEHADLIRYAVQDAFRTWQWDTHSTINTTLANAIMVERITNIDTLEWRNTDRRRATLYEVWYRKWTRGLILKLPNGKAIPFDKTNDRHVAVVSAGAIQPQLAAYSVVRVAFYLGPHRLYDMPSPYPHRSFPYVPFWGFREHTSGVPYGIIRAMMSPQDVINSADSKMHWMLNSRRLRASSDAIDTRYNTWSNVKESLARADSIVLLDPAKPNATWKEDNDNGLTMEQFQRRQQAAADIDNAGGTYKSSRGQESNATSGVAKSTDIEMGNIVMAEINDNYSFSRRHVGNLLFSMVREDLLVGKMPVMVKKEGKKQLVVLNQPQPDGSILNEVAAVPCKVVLEDVPSTPAFKQQQFQALTEVTKSLPPQFQAAIIDLVIQLTDIPEKDKVVERLRKVAGIQDDLTPEEQQQAQDAAQQVQQLQRQIQQMALDKQSADIELVKAKAAQLESMIAKGDSEKMLKIVEAMYAAIQAGQIIATVPGVAPVADELMKGAGYVDQNGQDAALAAGGQPVQSPGQPAAQPPDQQGGPTDQAMPNMGMPRSGMPAQVSPAAAAGVMHGIETQRNDGAQPA
jgi:hypothetical protein